MSYRFPKISRSTISLIAHSTRHPRTYALITSRLPPNTPSFFSTSSARGGIIPGFDPLDSSSQEEDGNDKNQKSKEKYGRVKDIFTKAVESACITFASVSIIALAGYGYQKYYHKNAISKMEEAFFPEKMAKSSRGTGGHHPLSHSCADTTNRAFPGESSTTAHVHVEGHEDDFPMWVERPQQKLLDDIISGKIAGRYYLLVGEKGTGKTSMLLEAMRRTKGQYCTMFDAHPDPEIFRIRLGRALNFEFFEDYIGGMFSLRGPRDTTALLDIERAFNKLEYVATDIKKRTGRPLVLVINNIHMIRDDEIGQHLVELLQQKAETLAGAVTLIFNSDDYWVYERLKKLGTRLEVVTIRDMSRKQAIQTLKAARRRILNENLTTKEANDIYNLVGGRPQHLAAVAASLDPKVSCHKLIDRERTWFLNQCGLLGEGMDDDVMESGKFSTSAMLLMRALVEMDNRRGKCLNEHPENELEEDHVLPQVPLWIARRIMTRPDYIQVYDNLNIFTIDSNSFVRADSVPMMQAFHEIAAMPKFDELLEETMDRVSAIESLGRTRELVAKDLVQSGGLYRFLQEEYQDPAEKDSANKGIFYNGKSGKKPSWILKLEQPQEDEEEEDNFDNLNLNEERKSWWWRKRDAKFNKKQ